jgi:hypothetical protein
MPLTCPNHRSTAVTHGQQRLVPPPAELHDQPTAGSPKVLPKLAVLQVGVGWPPPAASLSWQPYRMPEKYNGFHFVI